MARKDEQLLADIISHWVMDMGYFILIEAHAANVHITKVTVFGKNVILYIKGDEIIAHVGDRSIVTTMYNPGSFARLKEAVEKALC